MSSVGRPLRPNNAEEYDMEVIEPDAIDRDLEREAHTPKKLIITISYYIRPVKANREGTTNDTSDYDCAQ